MLLLFLIFMIAAVLTVIVRAKNEDRDSIVPRLDKDMTLVLKGLMILFVLVGHICNFVLKDNYPSWWVYNLSSFGLYAVSMFLFMSGYGLMFSLEKKEKYLEGFLMRRLTKVLLPLVVTTIIFLPANFFVQGQTWQDILSAFLVGRPPLRFSWFAYMIVYAYVLFYVCANKIEFGWKLIVGMVVGLLFYALILKFIGWKEHWYASSLSIPLGMCVCLYREKIGAFFVNRTALCIFFTILAMLVTFASGAFGLSYWMISLSVPLCIYIYIYMEICRFEDNIFFRKLFI